MQKTSVTREEWLALTDEQRAEIKSIHARVRHAMHEAAPGGGWRHRYAILAWAFVRGIPYRRIEPRHRFQTVGGQRTDRRGVVVRAGMPAFEHNVANPFGIYQALVEAGAMPKLPGWQVPTELKTQLDAWIAEPLLEPAICDPMATLKVPAGKVLVMPMNAVVEFVSAGPPLPVGDTAIAGAE